MSRLGSGSDRAKNRVRRGLALVVLGSLSACLVTNKVDFEEPFIPSVITRVEPAQQIVRAPAVRDERCERLVPGGDMYFQFSISDLNLEEALEVYVLVNDSYAGNQDVSPEGRSEVEFCVQESRFTQACNRVEVYVSSDFRRGNTPREEGDRAVAHWWVLGSAIDEPTASHLDCEEDLRDAGVP